MITFATITPIVSNVETAKFPKQVRGAGGDMHVNQLVSAYFLKDTNLLMVSGRIVYLDETPMRWTKPLRSMSEEKHRVQ